MCPGPIRGTIGHMRRTPYKRTRRFKKTYLAFGARTPQMTDAGKDAPLSNRAYLVWGLVIVGAVGLLALLSFISR